MSAATPSTDENRDADDVRPIVPTGGSGKLGLIAFLIFLALGGAWIISLMTEQRTALGNEGPLGTRADPAARISSPPPLALPVAIHHLRLDLGCLKQTGELGVDRASRERLACRPAKLWEDVDRTLVLRASGGLKVAKGRSGELVSGFSNDKGNRVATLAYGNVEFGVAAVDRVEFLFVARSHRPLNHLELLFLELVKRLLALQPVTALSGCARVFA